MTDFRDIIIIASITAGVLAIVATVLWIAP